MDAQQVYDHILKIAAASGRIEKGELLKELLDTDLGKYVITQAYDPFITYGVKPVMPKAFGAEPFDLKNVKARLSHLATRKITGNDARATVQGMLEGFDEAGAHLVYWMLNKDVKAGIAANTILEVAPGLIPVFSVMRAQAFEERFIKKWPVFVEPKYDGFRVSFLCRDGHGGFFTRSGKRMPQLDHLVEPVIKLALTILQEQRASQELLETLDPVGSLINDSRSNLNFMLDSEAVTGSFQATSGDLRRKGEEAEATLIIFDIMSYAEFDAVGSHEKPYTGRRALVEEFVGFVDDQPLQKSERYYANSLDEVMGLYEGFRNRGLEGAMVKIADGAYDKKKSRGWLKIKPEETEDLRIVGYFNGEAGTKYESMTGGLIFRRENGVHVRVGGGYSDAEREELWGLWEHDAKILGVNPAVGFKPGYELDPAVQAQTGFKLLGRLGEIEFHEETPDGSLRHPRFKRFRDDKDGEVESKEAA